MRLVLDNRLMCDLELLLNGSFAPLTGFLTQQDYNSVIENNHLSDGSLWPMPIVLPVTKQEIDAINGKDNVVTLCDKTNLPIATIEVKDVYQPDLDKECSKVYGDGNHPYTQIVKKRQNQGKIYYIGGPVTKLREIPHCDFQQHRMTPEEVKQLIKAKNWQDKPIVAFQTRNPMHRSHFELTQYALKQAGKDSKLILQPIVGVTQECDIDYFTRVKCYTKLLNYYQPDTAILSLLPLSMRMAGPREALWHSLIRKNYGATHFVVGRDHAGPSCKNMAGKPFYDPYGAHQLIESLKDELKIKVIKSKLIVYVEGLNEYMAIDQVPDQHKPTIRNISGTEQRRMLREGLPIPSWFSFPEIVEELRKSVSNKQGLCIYVVGLSGSGKTTISQHLQQELRQHMNIVRPITLLDGDVVRQNLSKGLGFSKEDRSTNVRRIGYVASEIVKHGGVVICANIAPYREDREYNRDLISKYGKYVEVYVNTSVEICEIRDVKGLYNRARKGEIKLTGINDPFETPSDSEIEIQYDDINNQVHKIIQYILSKNLL